MSSRESLYYKIVLTVKSSVPHSKLQGRDIPDDPPFSIHGFFCIDCEEKVLPASKAADDVVYDYECKVEKIKKDGRIPPTGFVSGKHLLNEKPREFWKQFWRQPATEIISKNSPLYTTMCKLWPGLSNYCSEKTWEYQVVKHKYGIDDCTPEFYLKIATQYGEECMDVIMRGLRQQKVYSFGTGEKFFCKEFQKWVNSIFKVKVDCRFQKLHPDDQYFGLLKIGVLGRLNLDKYVWKPVNLIVSKANVGKDEEINDLSQFYLQNLSERRINNNRKRKRMRGHKKPAQKKQRR